MTPEQISKLLALGEALGSDLDRTVGRRLGAPKGLVGPLRKYLGIERAVYVPKPLHPAVSDADVESAWMAVREHGSYAKAARALGDGSPRARVFLYKRAHIWMTRSGAPDPLHASGAES